MDQRAYTSKHDSSSPTVTIESLMLLCVIDTKEGRKVATVDIHGAFMQCDMDKLVHVKFEGVMAEMIINIDPNQNLKYARTEGGKTAVYAALFKALYGNIRALFIFWRKLTREIKSLGFKINPCNWFVANNTIDI